MKHTHVIEAANAQEFKKHVAELYHSMHSQPLAESMAAEEKVEHASKPSVVEKTEEKPKKTTKPVAAKKEEKPEAAPAPAAEPAAPVGDSADDIFGDEEEKKPAVVPYTMDDCQKRLQAVVKKHDITKGKALLNKFGIAKLVELKADQFANFIGACDELT